jgi:ribosomal protein S27E
MSRLVKVCRVCKTENPADARGFCLNCGQPLAGLEPEEIDDNASGQLSESKNAESLVRCPACGDMTRPLVMCDHCNQELPKAAGDVANVSASIETTTVLEMIVGTQNYQCRNGDILGRSGTLAADIFQGIDTVSSRHVLLTKEGGKWFVTVFAGVQNTTQLDDQELRRGVRYALCGEHRLRMSQGCEVILRFSP